MSIFDSMNISTSGLSLERLKLDTISTNIANVNTTRTEEGGPYLQKEVVFEEALKQSADQYGIGTSRQSYGVKAVAIEENEDDIVREYDPTSPDADADGYVQLSNVNMADEMVAMMETMRTYDANLSAFEAGKDMFKQALTISAK